MSDSDSTWDNDTWWAAIRAQANMRLGPTRAVTLWQLRQARGIRQRDLATIVGVGYGVMASAELDPLKTRWGVLLRCLDAVGATDVQVTATVDGQRVAINLVDPPPWRTPPHSPTKRADESSVRDDDARDDLGGHVEPP